jgi:hypothetical protein
MSTTCGHRWKARYLQPPPSKKVTSVEQICALPKGHAGPHESLAKVQTPQ